MLSQKRFAGILKRSNIHNGLGWLITCVLTLASCNLEKNEAGLRLNDIQIIGSHNSYKKAIDPELMKLIYAEDSMLAVTLEYAHLPLRSQLEQGMRNLELDIFHDPEGGRFSHPLGMIVTSDAAPYDTMKMNQPGFKVMHVQDIDFRSHHYFFKEALEEIRKWSDLNPDHIPLIITINLKDEIIDREDFVKPLPFGTAALDSVDRAILSIFDWDRLIHPDLIRGVHETLEKAVLTDGWPLLSSARGKILFVLDANEEKNRRYSQNHPSLSGRVMFINVPPGQPESAFCILNNPVILFDEIRELVEKGYMVRTRADANTIEARMNDYRRWEMAKSSGAQVITTDYYRPSTFFQSDYRVGFGADTVYRVNPVRKFQ